MPKRKLRGFQLRVFRFEYSVKWKAWSLIKGALEKIRGFNSEFFVLGIVQNGKLEVENLGKLILQGFRVFRELRVFDLAVTQVTFHEY